MASTCPNCANRVKADYGAPGSDFWRCTAEPVLPEFVLQQHHAARDPDAVMRLINLRLFDADAPTGPRLNVRSCPLFTPHPIQENSK